MITKAVLVGTKPLMMSTQAGLDPQNSLAKEKSLLTSKVASKLTTVEIEIIQWNCFQLNLHWSKLDGVVVPGINIIKAVQEAATKDKKGKDVLRYIQATQDFFPLLYEGPQDKRELFDVIGEDGKRTFADTRYANHGTRNAPRMVAETRPIFREWGLEVGFRFDTEEIEPKDLERWLRRCGEYGGIGAYKAIYGRFAVTSFKEVKLDR